ncbi:MAG TPA: DUF1015 domain-containing protein [bacterium]|nr:DUF1015 domain-containing protein [bacterium]HOL66133.1 DUF1015 domain-containing protein [bacterium]HPP11609.1 DUF1015 domain-containing protein [bacterium]
MAEIRPFTGWRYNEMMAGEIGRLLAPPWDVIDEEKRARLLNQSPYNIVHLIDRKADPARVAVVWQQWREQKIVVPETAPCFYLLRHRFSHQGQNLERTGILALLKLEDFSSGRVIPHEQIFDRYRDNRLKLIGCCRANFSPVFLLYKDGLWPEKLVEEATALTETVFEGDSLTLLRLNRETVLARIQEFFEPEPLFIADGHHRYQAALAYARNHPQPENQYVMVYLVSLRSPGLLIAPTHRYIPGEISLERPELKSYFQVETVPDLSRMFSAMPADGTTCFGAWDGKKFFVLTLKEMNQILPFLPEQRSLPWKTLDGVVLHYFLLPRLLGVSHEGSEKKFFYDRDPEAVMAKRRQQGQGLVFFLRPVKKEQFVAVASSGEVMPQKSTYFFPKVPSGLVIHYFGKQ